MVAFYNWVSINALLMKYIHINGHITIIFMGIPLIYVLVVNLRQRRIDKLMDLSVEKVKSDIDALIMITTLHEWAHDSRKNISQDMHVKGIINLHLVECSNSLCPCKNP